MIRVLGINMVMVVVVVEVVVMELIIDLQLTNDCNGCGYVAMIVQINIIM